MNRSPSCGEYSTHSGAEFFLSFYPKYQTQVILLEALLEERNFLHRTVVQVAHLLGAQGIGSAIPDLPGCAESIVTPDEVAFPLWREAIADFSAMMRGLYGHPVHIVSFRGAALIDDAGDAASWWRYAPATGSELLRPFRRAQRLRGEREEDVTGYGFASAMVAALDEAIPVHPSGPLREVQAEDASTPLWYRSEPSQDNALSEQLANDISQWIAECGA